jgi:hypothetical protein
MIDPFPWLPPGVQPNPLGALPEAYHRLEVGPGEPPLPPWPPVEIDGRRDFFNGSAPWLLFMMLVLACVTWVAILLTFVLGPLLLGNPASPATVERLERQGLVHPTDRGETSSNLPDNP